MPFKKVGKDDYTSPSGRHYNTAQVRLWHARGGKFPGEKGPGEMSSKGSGPRTASYAEGGPVLGRTREFLKEPDEFTDGRLPPKDSGRADDPPQGYLKGKLQSRAAPPLRNKQIAPPKISKARK
jgi:hypothetical protein